MLIKDPLKIFYLVMLASDEPEAITPFQGFSLSWQPQHWALHRLATLPADILEPSQPQNDIIAQRMGGMRPIAWAPLSASSLNQSASFVARLMYRLADFLPAAMNAHKRALDWREVISGMLRMTLATEILDELIGPPAPLESPRGRIQLRANMDINAKALPEWYERLIENIGKEREADVAAIAKRASGVVSRSDSIRYVQFGNPETILIDDGRIRKRVMEEYGQDADR